MRYLNLVLQGGGVRGIAYAGVLDVMPQDIAIHAIGGTSAGAIVAALVAIGKRGAELEAILQSKELFELVDPADSDRLNKIQKAWDDFAPLVRKAQSGKVSWVSFGLALRRHREMLAECKLLWSRQGLNSSERLEKFLTKALEGKRFKDIVVHDLKIVAADVSNREFVIYDKRDEKMLIADAVLASASIPFFFNPVRSGTRYLVDGGALSNFPAFLFAQGEYQTVGLRLRDLNPPETITSTGGYLVGLGLTMAEAHDKQYGDPPHFRAWEIPTPRSIPSTKFSLSPAEARDLFNVGQETGKNVAWDEFALEQPMLRYYDPMPQDALQFSIEQAFTLWELYSNEELYVDHLVQDYVFTARIDSDWTVHYERSGSLEVNGKRSLILTRTRLEAPGPRLLKSLVEVEGAGIFNEISSDGTLKALIRIPAFNGETEKGFLLFYSPPIEPGQGKRYFQTRFSVNKEFAETVARGQMGVMSYAVKQLGKKHSLNLSVRVLLEVGLPDLILSTESGERPIATGKLEVHKVSKKKYLVHECQCRTDINSKFNFDIIVKMKK